MWLSLAVPIGLLLISLLLQRFESAVLPRPDGVPRASRPANPPSGAARPIQVA